MWCVVRREARSERALGSERVPFPPLFPVTTPMAEEAGRRKPVKKAVPEASHSTSSPTKPASEEPVSPRSKDGSSAGRTRIGSQSKDKDSPSKGDKEKTKTKEKDKEGRNKHALSRTAQRQNSIMPVPMPTPDKVEEIFQKLLVRSSNFVFYI